MSNTQKHKHTCRLWRVNIDGKIVEGRWKNALGAISGAADKLFGNAGLREPRPDFTDMVIHVECIGDVEPHPKPQVTEPVTEPHVPEQPTGKRSAMHEQPTSERAAMQRWYQAMGGIVDWKDWTLLATNEEP